MPPSWRAALLERIRVGANWTHRRYSAARLPGHRLCIIVILIILIILIILTSSSIATTARAAAVAAAAV